ncbi:hypothetical protein [Acinetobacter guillouiae]|uniref:hypothetical protein n=1 Tax=Acinetobacter guillouiae TaxID=106649 RepID=UPI0028E8D0D6|nr:hypothetical protein [Acinetobacter guillouiae]
MDINKIRELALANGFSLKEQASGNMDLHSYVYEFANALLKEATPEGFVLMPIKPTETMVMAVVKEHEGEAFLPYSLYDAYVKQAMIEAQEQSHD